ncbi:unnamed protein product [Agarophyton chilense]
MANSDSPRRARPRLTEQIQIIRELWLLRESARVRAAEHRFVAQLERLLGSNAYSSPPPPLARVSFVPVAASRVPTPPVAPPPPPLGRRALWRTGDAAVYESQPASRDDASPARERRAAFPEGIEVLRARQPVTNLSAQFRARLEGTEAHRHAYRGIVRSRSFGQLNRQRAVSALLESEFRNQLEALISRGDTRAARTTSVPSQLHLDTQISYPPQAELASLVKGLQQEITVLKNVMSASFDLQLDIQRSIRQEVCAALNRAGVKHVAHSPSCAVQARTERVAKAGACTVCLEKNVDCVLYACGHMCTCSLCARQLLSSGQKCPICRAPVRDVVRAFVVTEAVAT